MVQGSIIRSRATWYEKGEKNNYFLKIKRRKVLVLKNNMTSSDLKAIMDELNSFYSDLYNNRSEDDTEDLQIVFFNNPQIPKLTNILRNACEGLLTVTECFNTSSFKNNETPGNDGLTRIL